MVEHTPGPWRVSEEDPNRIQSEDYGLVAVVIDNSAIMDTPGGVQYYKEQRDSNSRLIAGAPELLEASKELLRTIPKTFRTPEIQKSCGALEAVLMKIEKEEC